MVFSFVQALGLGTLTLAVVLAKVYFGSTTPESKFPLPPGPKRRPIIGNLVDIPQSRPWLKFTEWKEKFGSVVYLEVFGNPIVVLNDFNVVADLLERRSVIYSDRPRLIMVGELFDLKLATPLLHYNTIWRRNRKLMHSTFNPEAVKNYIGVQEDAVALFLQSLLENPTEFSALMRLTAGRIVISVTYGMHVQTPESEYITQAEYAMSLLGEAMVPGRFLVDVIPLLKYVPAWFPGAGFKKFARHAREELDNMVNRPFLQVRRDMAEGCARPSFVRSCLELAQGESSLGSQDEEDEIIRRAAGALYGAGAETTYAASLTFMLAMTLNPEVQAKAKAEIQRVIGPDRLPSLEDREKLPYVEACIKETLRWRPGAPLSIPRRTSKADIYNGYYIPKGATIMPNVWAISIDNCSGIPSDEFVPERFLPEFVKESPIDPGLYAFGFGRRICPGRHLAENSLYLTVTGLLATFTLRRARSVDGKDIDISAEFTSGNVIFPEPFQAEFSATPEGVRLINDRCASIG